MRLVHTVVVNAEREAVWNYVDDPNNLATLNPGLKSMRHVAGPERDAGAVYELIHTVGDREVLTTATITDRRPPSSMTTESTSEMGVTTTTFAFKSVNYRTEWTLFIEYRFKGFYWLASLFTRGAMRKAQRAEMEAMAERVEAGLRG